MGSALQYTVNRLQSTELCDNASGLYPWIVEIVRQARYLLHLAYRLRWAVTGLEFN